MVYHEGDMEEYISTQRLQYAYAAFGLGCGSVSKLLLGLIYNGLPKRRHRDVFPRTCQGASVFVLINAKNDM